MYERYDVQSDAMKEARHKGRLYVAGDSNERLLRGAPSLTWPNACYVADDEKPFNFVINILHTKKHCEAQRLPPQSWSNRSGANVSNLRG